jgi:hypothetical protein
VDRPVESDPARLLLRHAQKEDERPLWGGVEAEQFPTTPAGITCRAYLHSASTLMGSLPDAAVDADGAGREGPAEPVNL